MDHIFIDWGGFMVLEHCDLEIDVEKQAQFEKAIVRGVETIISKAKGFKGYQVSHSLETPSRYLLLIYWETLENHTIDFRGSAAFADWRAIVGSFFVKPPMVEHMTLVSRST
jgi:heme-degrading monooxygenase HmoA